MDVWYNVAKSIVRTYLMMFTDGFQVNGAENIISGPKIVVANHNYATDAFVVPFIFPEKLNFFVQSELFTLPILGRIMALADQIPVTIGQGKEALRIARERLAMGNTVVIFPEGHLNHGEALRRAGSGAAILAVQSGAPLLPMGIYVPDHFVKSIRGYFFNRDTLGSWQTHGRLFVSIGQPWLPQVTEIADRGYQSVRQITNHMMEQITQLMQQAQQMAQLKLK